MLDLLQAGMPAIVEAHGKKWLAVYHVRMDENGTLFIATEADANGQVLISALPAPLQLVLAPHDPATAEFFKRQAELKRQAETKKQEELAEAREKDKSGE